MEQTNSQTKEIRPALKFYTIYNLFEYLEASGIQKRDWFSVLSNAEISYQIEHVYVEYRSYFHKLEDESLYPLDSKSGEWIVHLYLK
jgi:hypothetical protein